MSADQLAQLLDEIGKRLGPAGEHVFALAVQRAFVNAALWEALGVFMLVVAVTSFVFALVYIKRHPDLDEDSWETGFLIFSGFGSVLFAAIGLMAVVANLVTLLTPEYSALQDILKTVTGK